MARSIENQTRSIEAYTYCFFAEFSNSAQARLMCRVFCFFLSIKGKTLATFLVAPYAVCVNLLRDQKMFAFTHTQGFQDSRLCQELDDRFSCCIQKLKDTQAGVLVLARNSRKKQSVNSKLSWGCGSKFSTQGSNRMLMV